MEVSQIDIFTYLQFNISKESLSDIFGTNLGNHLFLKWNFSNENIIIFLNSLDFVNQNKCIDWGRNHIKKDIESVIGVPRES